MTQDYSLQKVSDVDLSLDDESFQVLKMREILGTESSNTWINFMDYVTETLPFLSQGKPKKSDISKSIIGHNGFTSWIDMIIAPTENGGLAWNISSWKAWRRAYSVVEKYEYLRDLELSASKINTIYNETKSDFPPDLESFEEFLEDRVKVQSDRQQNSLKDAQKTVEQVKDQLEEALKQLGYSKQKADACEAELLITKKHLTDSAIETGSLREKLSFSEKEVSRLQKDVDRITTERTKARKSLTNYKALPFWKKIF